MVDTGYMFDYYDDKSIETPWTMSYDGKHRRLYECGTEKSESSLKSVPYSAMDSNSYQSLLSLRSSTIPPKDCASLRAFSTTVSSSGSLHSHSSIASTVYSTVSSSGGGPPLLSAPLPIYSLHSRRKREAEFFQAEYIPVELWRANRLQAAWAPPSDQPYHEVEWLRVSRGRQPAALIADGVCFDETSDGSRTPPTSTMTASAAAAPAWTSVNEEQSSTEYSTTVMATTDAIEEEWARNVQELGRELAIWSTSSPSVLSPLSSDLSSVDLSTPTMTTACSIDAWDCETQLGEDTDAPLPAKSSMLRGIYDLLAAIFCSRRKREEERIVTKNVDVKMDRGYD